MTNRRPIDRTRTRPKASPPILIPARSSGSTALTLPASKKTTTHSISSFSASASKTPSSTQATTSLAGDNALAKSQLFKFKVDLPLPNVPAHEGPCYFYSEDKKNMYMAAKSKGYILNKNSEVVFEGAMERVPQLGHPHGVLVRVGDGTENWPHRENPRHIVEGSFRDNEYHGICTFTYTYATREHKISKYEFKNGQQTLIQETTKPSIKDAIKLPSKMPECEII